MTDEGVPMQLQFKLFHHPCPILPTHLIERHLWTEDCGTRGGCLFDVDADPEERTDRASDPEQNERLARMHALLKAMNQKLFRPDRGHGSLECCLVASEQGGFYGPWLGNLEEYYNAPVPEAANSLRSVLYRNVLMPLIHIQAVQDVFIRMTAYLTIMGDPPTSLKMTKKFRVCSTRQAEEPDDQKTALGYLFSALGITF
jgi:hypothetical protein